MDCYLIMLDQFKIKQNKQQETNLKHGQFKVCIKSSDDQPIEHIVNHLTQQDHADDWTLVLPREKKNSTTHHFTVYLSQLPQHLWNKIRKDPEDNANQRYEIIRDNIYYYTIKPASTDNDVLKLYKLVTKQYTNKQDLEHIQELHTSLAKENVKGWVMIRAKNVLNLQNCID